MEVTRPLLLRLFYQVKWPITPNKSAGSVVAKIIPFLLQLLHFRLSMPKIFIITTGNKGRSFPKNTSVHKVLQNVSRQALKECSQKSQKLFWASNATPKLLWHQMPPSCYWVVKCHPWVLGLQMPPSDYMGFKGHTGVKRLASRFMRSQSQGRQRSGESGIRWGVRSQISGIRDHSVKWPGRQRR